MIIFWFLWIPIVLGQEIILNTSVSQDVGSLNILVSTTSFNQVLQTKLESFTQKFENERLILGERFNAVKTFVTKTATLIGNTFNVIFHNETFQFCFDIPSRQISKKVCLQFKINNKRLAMQVAVIINSKVQLSRMVSPIIPRAVCFRYLEEFKFCLDPFESFVDTAKKHFKICFELKLKAFDKDLLGINLNCFEVDDKEVSLSPSISKSKENVLTLNTGEFLDLKSKIKLFNVNSRPERAYSIITMEDDIVEGLKSSRNDLDFYTKEIGWTFEEVKDYFIDLAHYLLLAEYSVNVKKTMFCFDLPLREDLDNFSIAGPPCISSFSACTTFTLDNYNLGVHTEMTFDSKLPLETTISARNNADAFCTRIPGFELFSICIKRTKWSISEDEKSFEICLEMGIMSHNVNLIGLNLNCYSLENGRDFYLKAYGGKPCKYLINLDAGKLNGKLGQNQKIKMFTLTPEP